MTNGTPIPAPSSSWARDPKKVLLAIAVFAVFAIVAGGAFAWIHRYDTICKDGRPPRAQRSYGIGQVQYLCHDGELVTKP